MDYRIGQQIGNYRLVSQIGQGGFAEVYLGEHVHLDTQAAIKFLHARLDASAIDLFKVEARTIARLDHPHIIRVQDFGLELDGTPYLIMTYAPYGTLRQRHPMGMRVPLSLVVSYVEQVASALQYAHNQRIVHRDVKPENLLIGNHQQILLGDFGIALMVQSSRQADASDMAGTIAYMAPEQIEAHPRASSDQYALAVLVYEWLCGARPFVGSFTELAIKHATVVPPSLRSRVPDISPAVEEVVLTALAKDPTKRFSTVDAFARALKHAAGLGQLDGTTTLAVGVEDERTIPDARRSSLDETSALAPNETRYAGSSGHMVAAPASTTHFAQTVRDEPPMSQPDPARRTDTPVLDSTRHAGLNPAGNRGGGTPGYGLLPSSKKSSRFYFIAALVLVLVIVAGFVILPRLTAPRGDYSSTIAAHTQYFPGETAITRENAQNIEKSREINLLHESQKGEEDSSLVYIDNERFYTLTEQYLRAFNLSDGKPAWETQLTEEPTSNGFIAGNVDRERGIIFITGVFDEPVLYAVNLTDGKSAWSNPFRSDQYEATEDPVKESQSKAPDADDRDAYVTQPVYANGLVYFGETKRQLLFAVTAGTGELQWSKPLSTRKDGWGNLIAYDLSHPSVVDGKVYIQSENGQVMAFEAQEGEELWSKMSQEGAWTTPAVAHSTVYLTYGGKVLALDANSGEKRWEKTVGEAIRGSVVTDKAVLVSFGDEWINANRVKALNVHDGNELWESSPIPRQGDSSNSGTALVNGTAINGVVFFGTASYWGGSYFDENQDAHLYAFDTENGGRRLLSVLVSEEGGMSPYMVANGALYLLLKGEKDTPEKLVEYRVP